ncbi:hypothetical protein [Arcobacter vandammei]|uniref:hypothetical protein n=1 Tax=Arcobacter vandammei TaxID=2782243 RepID=UPI0018DFCA18|nr:hypothetical protein [Arcobacter vandammei]
MQKNSFTLFETVISITILLISVTIFHQISKDNLNEDKIYMLLNSLENSFNSKNYTNFNKSSKQVEITKNGNIVEKVELNIYSYKDENIKLFKYEK